MLAADVAIGEPPAIALVRTGERVVASWRRRDLPDGGADPDSGAKGPPVVAAIDVAVVDALGDVVTRLEVPAPAALRSRRAGVEDVGIVPVGDAWLVHWTETSASTDPDGRVRSASVVKASVVAGAATQPEPEPEPVIVVHSCEQCLIAVTFTGVADAALAFVRIDPDFVEASLGAAIEPRFVALGVRRDGAVTQETAAWLALPPRPTADASIGGVGLATAGSRRAPIVEYLPSGRIAVSAGGRAWLADDALRVVAGPIALPAASDTRMIWEASGEAAIAWSISPFEDGRADEERVPREIFTGIVPFGAAGIGLRERTSRGRALLGFDRRGDDLGLVFESAGRTLFAAVDSHGRKRGGDVVVGTSSMSRSEYGAVDVPRAHTVLAHGEGRFTVLALGAGELAATEIACDH